MGISARHFGTSWSVATYQGTSSEKALDTSKSNATAQSLLCERYSPLLFPTPHAPGHRCVFRLRRRRRQSLCPNILSAGPMRTRPTSLLEQRRFSCAIEVREKSRRSDSIAFAQIDNLRCFTNQESDFSKRSITRRFDAFAEILRWTKGRPPAILLPQESEKATLRGYVRIVCARYANEFELFQSRKCHLHIQNPDSKFAGVRPA